MQLKQLYNFSLLFLLTYFCTFSQQVQVKWAALSKNSDGIHEKIIGTNANNIYTIDSTEMPSKDFSNPCCTKRKIRITAILKSNLQFKKAITLNAQILVNEKTIDLAFYKLIVNKKQLLVFWINNLRKTEELYVQTIHEDLEIISEVKKIFVLKTAANAYSKSVINTQVLFHPLVANQFIIGGELEAEMFKKIPFQYSVFDSAFNSMKSNTVLTPAILGESQKGNNMHYQLEQNGKIYAYQSANIKAYPLTSSRLMCIHPETNQTFTKIFNSPQLYNFNYYWQKNTMSITGFIDEIEEEELSRYTGIYFAELDIENLNLKHEKKINFNKASIYQLFGNIPNEIKNESRWMHTDEERVQIESTLNPNFIIEKQSQYDTNHFLIIASRNKLEFPRYSNTNLNTITININTKLPGLEKGNIIAFDLNKTEGLKWSKCIERLSFYPYHLSKEDMVSYQKNTVYYLFYPNTNQKVEGEKKSRLAYTTFQIDNGQTNSKILNLEAPGLISDLQKIGDQIYFTTYHELPNGNSETYIGEINMP